MVKLKAKETEHLNSLTPSGSHYTQFDCTAHAQSLRLAARWRLSHRNFTMAKADTDTCLQVITKERVKVFEDRIRIWVFRGSFKVNAEYPVTPLWIRLGHEFWLIMMTFYVNFLERSDVIKCHEPKYSYICFLNI